MNIGIVISQVEPEAVWNAFRFANFSISSKGVSINAFTVLWSNLEFDLHPPASI